MNVELSQGSHFFHNLSSFRASYFMVQHGRRFWNQLGLAEPAARCARDGAHPPCAADREALSARRWADSAEE